VQWAVGRVVGSITARSLLTHLLHVLRVHVYKELWPAKPRAEVDVVWGLAPPRRDRLVERGLAGFC
jgi:hypothetical protein